MTIDEIRKIHYERKGEERGIEKGIEIVAINMLKNGKSIDEIVKDTGLSYEAVEELKKSIK